MFLRKTVSTALMVVLLSLTLSVAALAITYSDSDSNATEDGRLLGSITLTVSTTPNPQACSASITGRSISYQKPQDLLVRVTIYDGAGLVAANNVAEMVDFFANPATVVTQAGPGTCLYWAVGAGYHYAQWAIGDEMNIPTNVTIVPGASSASSMVACPAQDVTVASRLCAQYMSDYTKSSVGVGPWRQITLEESIARLNSLLGTKAATRLNVAINRDLKNHIHVGDAMPGILLSPDGTEALVLYFHNDGSFTAVRFIDKEGSWVIKSTNEETMTR